MGPSSAWVDLSDNLITVQKCIESYILVSFLARGWDAPRMDQCSPCCFPRLQGCSAYLFVQVGCSSLSNFRRNWNFEL